MSDPKTSPDSRPSPWAVALFLLSCALAVVSFGLFSTLYVPF